MTVLLERLELAGFPLTWLPPGEFAQIKPNYVSEMVQTLTGAVFMRGPLTGYTLTLNPPDTFVIPLALKRVLNAAFASSSPVSVVETYSDPEVVTSWAGGTLLSYDAKEVAGSKRQYFTYSLTLLLGV